MTTSSIVTRTTHILDILAEAPEPMSFSQIVDASGLPKSSVHRLLSILLAENLLEQDIEGQNYRPGPRLLRWGTQLLNPRNLPSAAAPELERLNRQTACHAALSVLDKHSVLYLKTMETGGDVRWAPRVGEHSPLHASAAGKVLLAFSPKPKLERILAEIRLEAYTPYTITDRSRLKDELDTVIELGYAVCNREEFLQVNGLAAPVLDQYNEALAAISLWQTRENLPPGGLERHLPTLTAAAQSVSRQFGWNPI